MRRNSLAALVVAFTSSILLAGAARGADFTVTNSNANGPGSLHRAIVDANATPGPDRILFNIPGAGVHTIDVSKDRLPAITEAVVIDGYSQPGSQPNTLTEPSSNAVLKVRIDGKGGHTPQNPPYGFDFEANDCTLRGLIVTGITFGFNGQAFFGGDGVLIHGARCVVAGNSLGTDGSAGANLGNRGAGVRAIGAGNRIGGSTPADHNLIGGNVFGVVVESPNLETTDLLIAGNQIGTNKGQNEVLGNGLGVMLSLGTSTTLAASFQNVVVGGTDSSFANLISGNAIGVQLYDDSRPASRPANGVIVQGNLIGLQPHAADPQGSQAVGISVGGSDNMIGGLAAGAGNQIAYNQFGVLLQAPEASTTVLRNRILSNAIWANGIPIELNRTNSDGSDPLGPTLNDFQDPDTGPNNLQNYPIITSVGPTMHVPPGNENTTLKGVLNSTPNSDFTLQFFRYHLAPDLIKTLTVHTDAQGNAPFAFDIYVPPDQPGLVGAYYSATATDAAGNTSEMLPKDGPVQLANISTRGPVGAGENLMIAGFILQSPSPKKVLIRALGPSLAGVPNCLADPYLELYDSNGTLLAKNDDWRAGQQQEIIDTGLAPASDVESALITSLPDGGYTAQLRGANGGTGNAVVEVYDLDPFPSPGQLANISTRAAVGTDDDLLIGGFIVRGEAAIRVIARAIGPDVGVAGALPDPTLELRDSNGALIMANDNWRDSQAAEITATGLAPHDERDSALVAPLAPAAYTAIVRGKDGATGVALIEFYDLGRALNSSM